MQKAQIKYIYSEVWQQTFYQFSSSHTWDCVVESGINCSCTYIVLKKPITATGVTGE